MMEKLLCQRDSFRLNPSVTYLNGAYMSPQLSAVSEAGMAAVIKKEDPASISQDDFFSRSEQIRAAFSLLIDNPSPQRTVLIPSVSYGMANVARNLPADKRKIIVAAEQFPSNVYPWMQLQANGTHHVQSIKAPNKPNHRAELWSKAIVEAIDKDTAMVSVGHIHWADGSIFDLDAIRKKTREVGALLVIDGTQSVGALPFSVQAYDPDALICAGYKWLLGPYGLGMAYYGSYFDGGLPVEENWINRKNSEDFAALINYQNEYQPLALRYEMGEHSQFILLPMLLEGIRKLNIWKPERIQDYCRELIIDAKAEWREMGYLLQDDGQTACHLFGIYLGDQLDKNELADKLKAYRISVSIRGDVLRVSPNVYNTKEDIDRLGQLLKELKR